MNREQVRKKQYKILKWAEKYNIDENETITGEYIKCPEIKDLRNLICLNLLKF